MNPEIEDANHRNNIKAEIFFAIRALGMTTEMAQSITTAIVAGNIPHVSINY